MYKIRQLSELKKLENNPRTIKDSDFKKLVQSISENKQYFEARPVILSDRTGELVIIAGNQRYEAAKHLKLKEIPTFLISDLTEQKEREIIIRDNVSNGQWDFDLLANEWEAIDLENWGVDLPSFGEDIILAEEDEFDDGLSLGKQTDIVLGDIFEIGEHRLLCGDSTDSEQIARLFNGKKADLYISDPPYGVAYKGKTKEALEIKNDALTEDQTHQLFADAFANAFMNLKEGGGGICNRPTWSFTTRIYESTT